METIKADKVKELRLMTGAGIMDCKSALKDTQGDLNEAVKELRKRGKKIAEKKASRTIKEGLIEAYIHHGSKLGVLLEVGCETDFVARNDEFKGFVKEVAMQIAASSPQYVSRDDVPEPVIAEEKEILSAEIKNKPVDMAEKIVTGKIDKFFANICLLEQVSIRDQSTTIKELLENMIAKIGENIVIKRFSRFKVGE